MKILVGCEFSGIVREAFNAYAGNHAISCDILPAEDGRHDYHYQGDIRDLLSESWDLAIFHTPCTYLCNSGALRLYIGGKKANGPYEPRWEAMRKDAELFKTCMNAKIKRIAMENPIMHGHAKKLTGVTWTQIIQPHWFGHPESKATCLALKNLPPLVPTNVLQLPESGRWDNQTASGQNKLPPSDHRQADRSRTYPGIAAAMAEQWTKYILERKL